ncbi:MAG: toxin of toxin-antitoxin system [Sphingobacteriales bacterium 41-5]|nr:MAG: toxin of toxin-antitoxin system [Sphingobacteriales bacterium 41-5]
MEIELFADAIHDYNFWKRSGNKLIQNKILQLFNAMLESPFEGLGKPEPLKYDLSGKWPRRINKEHRIIYEVSDDLIKVYSLRGHY